MSMGASSSSSSGQYTESDVYAVYDDPCKYPISLCGMSSHVVFSPCSFPDYHWLPRICQQQDQPRTWAENGLSSFRVWLICAEEEIQDAECGDE